jgi:signal transduction histidine kinase
MLNILLADDDDNDRKQIKRALKQSGLPSICTEAASVEEALEACQACAFDCAIIDYNLPGRDGLAGISALHESLPHMAIIMLTGLGDETIAVQAMQRGALDYLSKKNLDAEPIGRSIENAVAKASLLKKLAEQRNELEVFTRVLVHDLKSPIHSALGFAGLIEKNLHRGSPEQIALYCGKVTKGLKRMAALIETLHRYASSEEQVVFEPVEMRDVMIDTLANLEDLIRNRAARVTFGELPRVSGTPQLGQLLQNLIGNGIKYCEAEIPLVHIAAKPLDGSLWQFSVRDNGIGIPEKDCLEVFEPFHRLRSEAKYDGTGLGLATCKKIVERHGGSISCQSEEGRGTTFVFTLHAAPTGNYRQLGTVHSNTISLRKTRLPQTRELMSRVTGRNLSFLSGAFPSH